MAREVRLTIHTTSGIEFEVTDASTGELLVERDYWCDEGDEDGEEQGWAYFRRLCERRGWLLTVESWS